MTIMHEQVRFGDHIPPVVQHALGDLPVRSYKPTDYGPLGAWMESLAAFYDGHTPQNRLIDQLVGAEMGDRNGFFTKSKALVVSTDPETGAATGATCINFKRGGAVKIGPIVVDSELRGRGIGKTLFEAADVFADAVGARKIFATTSHLNRPVNTLFERYGFIVEATFPDQYKHGSEELIWGKFVGAHPFESDLSSAKSVVRPSNGKSIGAIKPYSESNRGFIADVNKTYGDWHDDLGEDFIDGMVAGQERGLDFQAKGKVILVAEDVDGEPQGMLTFTPKRGGPVKIYPIAGTVEAQTTLLDKAIVMAQNHGNHKLYTFSPTTDAPQHELLISQGFTRRGILLSPYKDGHDLFAFDKMIS